MSKFLSGRQSNLNLGITSYTESKTVLQTTGKVGIGTTDAQQHSLFVVGSTNITGDTIVGGGATVVGIGSFQSDVYIDNQLYVAGISITGGATIGEDTVTRNLKATGISTFVGIATVESTLFTNQLSVSGVSTFNGNIDANGDLDVDGHTELDNVNISGVTTFVGIVTNQSTIFGTQLSVSGISTFNGLVDINANGQANSFKVEDLTNDRIVIAGSGGELEDDANLTFNGTQLFVGVDLDVDGHTELDNVNISGVTTFVGNIDANGNLDVDGHTELDDVNISGVSTFVGITTAQSTLFAAELSVSGVSTFNNNIDANGDLDVDGHTELDNVNISGVTTTVGLLDVNGGITANIATVEDLTNDRIVIAGVGGRLEDSSNLTFDGTTFNVTGNTELDALNVTGIATFSSNIDANGDLDVDGQTELDNLNVSGIATINSLDVQTNFDVYDSTATFHNNVYITGNLSIGGTTTVLQAQDLQIFDKDIILGVTTDSNGNDISTDITANHAGVAVASTEGNPLVDLYLEGLEELPTTYKKIMWFREGSFSGLGTDAWLFNYAVGIGSTQFPSGTRLAVGETKFTDSSIDTRNINASGNVSITGDIDVDGHTDLDNVSISGITTLSSNVTVDAALGVNGDLDVDGHTELDNLNVSGVSTFVGITTNESTLFANQLSVSGFTTVGNIQVGGFTPDGSNFGGAQYILRAIGDGTWEWADVPGIFSVNNILNGFTVSEEGPSNVVGTAGSITQLDFRGVNVTATADAQPNGIATITFSTTPTFDTLTVTGDTSLGFTTVTSDLYIAGVSTFVGVGTFQNDLYVGGDLYVKDDLVFDSFTAREINVTEASNLENLYVAGLSTFVGIATAESTLFTNQLNVAGVTTFFNDVTIKGSNSDLVVESGTIRTRNLHSNGTSLEIRGGGNTPTRPGILLPQNDTGDIEILGYNGGSGDLILDTRGSGNLELKHNGNIQATIDSVGIAFTDNVKARFGSGQDLQIYHDGNDSYITDLGTGNLHVNTNGSSIRFISDGSTLNGKIADFNKDGAVNLYYDNSKKFETTGYGVSVYDTLQVPQLNITGVSTFVGIATVESTLFTDQLNVSGVSTFQANVNLGDNDRLRLGDSQDLQIWHNGSNSLITDAGSGDLYIGGNSNVIITDGGITENKAKFITNGAVELYYDNSKKFETTGYGVTVYDTLQAPQLNITGVSTFSNTINAVDANFSGNVSIAGILTYEDVTNIDSIGIITARSDVKVGGNLDVVGITTLASAGGITTTGGDLYVNNDLYFNGDLYQNNRLFTSGIGIGSDGSNDQTGITSIRIGVGFTDINFVGTGLSVTGYGSTVVVDFGNIAAASAGAGGDDIIRLAIAFG